MLNQITQYCQSRLLNWPLLISHLRNGVPAPTPPILPPFTGPCCAELDSPLTSSHVPKNYSLLLSRSFTFKPTENASSSTYALHQHVFVVLSRWAVRTITMRIVTYT